MVVYEHIGVANKRVQSAKTIRELRSFLGSYEPTDPDAVFIYAAEQEINRLQTEVFERQDRIHELRYQILRRSHR
jgi:hypothetical protein